MQLTIDVKESALDKVLYLLEHLKSDVTILHKEKQTPLTIETLSLDDPDYQYILQGREERKKSPENYNTLDDVNWD
jgi:hypothetical protein